MSGIYKKKRWGWGWETVPIFNDCKNLGELRRQHVDHGATKGSVIVIGLLVPASCVLLISFHDFFLCHLNSQKRNVSECLLFP